MIQHVTASVPAFQRETYEDMTTAKYKKMHRKGQHTVTSTSRVNSISHPNVKLPCIKPINLVKPQYRRLKQASIIKVTSSQIIEASFFKWVKYPGIITIMIMMMIMIKMIMMMITIIIIIIIVIIIIIIIITIIVIIIII